MHDPPLAQGSKPHDPPPLCSGPPPPILFDQSLNILVGALPQNGNIASSVRQPATPIRKKQKKEEKPKENCQRAIPDGLCGAGGFRPP